MSANSRIRFGLQIVFVCLYITPSHYHHCAKFIWRHWTYKMPVRYNLSSVWIRLSIFSQLSIMQYVGLCVFSLPISFVMIERIYMLCLIIIIKSEVWTNYYPLFRVRSWNNGVRCMSFYILNKDNLYGHWAVGATSRVNKNIRIPFPETDKCNTAAYIECILAPQTLRHRQAKNWLQRYACFTTEFLLPSIIWNNPLFIWSPHWK